MEALNDQADQTQDNKENVSTSQPQPPANNNSMEAPPKNAPPPKYEIVYSTVPKPYLGGYKSLKTGLVYHHAFAQTDQIAREHKTKYHRDVPN